MNAAVTRLPTCPPEGEEGDQALVRLVQSLPRGSNSRDAACAELVARYQSLVRSCAQRYWQSPESREELMQVGYVGLLKAINNFDPEIGSNLAAYAQPCISGEIKRHFRDKRWQVHVKRSVQELRLEVRRAKVELTQRLARAPQPEEVARHLGVSEEDVLDALRADMVFQATSLDAPVTDRSDAANLADLMGADDPEIEHTLDMEAVWTHWRDLPERQQRLLMMRFYGNMTQSEIGQRLGVSQMHVSRLLASALDYLRGCLVGPDADEQRPG
jgi:RNA polymerase sigma-B factor